MLFHKRHDVICIGSVSKDIFFPTDGGEIIETPEDLTAQRKVAFELGGKYRVVDLHEAVGGVAANVAWGLAKLGVDAAPYSHIGGDETGHWILRELRSANVPTDRIFVDKTVRSDLSAIIVMMENGERTIFHNRNANDRLEIIPARLRGTGWFFVSAQNGKWESKIRAILDIAQKEGVKIALNPGQHNIKENPALVMEMVATCEVLALNKDEALELVLKIGAGSTAEELNDEKFLLSALVTAGAKKVCMTDGERGAWGTDGERYWHAPIGYVCKVVDTTGAGDAFTSAFFSAIAFHSKSVPEALTWGIAESGSVVCTYGASSGLLTLDELDKRVRALVVTEL